MKPGCRVGAGAGPAPKQFRGGPDRNGVDRECECEMRGQAILAHVGALGEPALHHVPAQGALHTEEAQEHHEPALECHGEPQGGVSVLASVLPHPRRIPLDVSG